MDNKKFSKIFIPRASFYLWIIFFLVGIIWILEWRVAIPGFALFIFLVYYNYRSNYVRKREITRYIENLTFNIDTASKDTLLNFPMPLVVTELDGTIIWYNSSFRGMFDQEKLLEKTINSFFEELNPIDMIGQPGRISREMVIGTKHYKVLGSTVKLEQKSESDQYIMVLYFIDITEHEELKKKYNEERIAVGTIIIDNYDDLMQSMEDANRQQMLAEIEKKIVQWSLFTEGIVKRYERDKYIFIFEIKHLKTFVDKKFDILDAVKEINLGNKIPVTLSIGFGINGKSLLESFKFSSAAIDIALGRGGDQVVIKDGKNFSFYGGRTREIEKRTKVKARVIAYALRELIDQSSEVLIMGHENADLDSLGASLGVYRIAKNRGKSAHIVLNQSNPAIDNLITKLYKNEEYANIFISCEDAVSRVDSKTLVVVVDTHRAAFTECPQLLENNDRIVVIDHHRKGADFIKDVTITYQETYASSTCELVSEILQYVDDKVKITPIEAEALFAGIVVDTKNFSFKTGVRTFEAASFLRRHGVDTASVKQLFQNDLNTYINRSNTVKNAEIIENNIAISICPPNISNAQLIAAQAADELLSLSGIVAAFVLSSIDGKVSISGRSLGDINVQMILEKLGGGGHLSAAGAQLEGISIEDAKQRLKCAIIDYMEEVKKE